MPGSLPVQQLLELLAVVSSFSDEASAIRGAAERAAQALEAEVAAVVIGGSVAAAVGFPAGAVPEADLLAVGANERSWIEVPGLDKCQAITANWSGTHPGQLIIARWGDEEFSVEERSLIRGMARLLELTLTMFRTLRAEQEMREQSERQAAENARLLESLSEQQLLMQHLTVIQKAISRRDPLPEIIDMIITATRELIGDPLVGVWVDDRIVIGDVTASVVPSEPCAAAEAVRRNDLVTVSGSGGSGGASMAAPVYESGLVYGALMVATDRPDRVYRNEEALMLRALAQNVSIALTDAHTVDRMNQAVHDTLTGLANRGLFLERLTEQLGRGTVTAVLFIDIDRFKGVNDSLGHAAGDQLLATVAARISGQLRRTDEAGRFGGDEFTLMLRNITDVSEATGVADRVIRALREPMTVAGYELTVDVSIGIALSPPGSPDPADLMRRADVAMYQAKRSGRGQYQVFTDDMIHDPIVIMKE
jgi:diguanylate cyclase (GGDEF)-like protein